MEGIYLIQAYGQSYVGKCINLDRRLRQHNRLEPGGAKATLRHAPNWRVVAFAVPGTDPTKSIPKMETELQRRVAGFKNQERRREEFVIMSQQNGYRLADTK